MFSKNIIGISQVELIKDLLKIQEKPFRSKQIWSWIYNRGVTDFSKMTNISLETREKLAKHFIISRPKISNMQISSDGTIKWLLKFSDCNEVETVFIPEKNHNTLCISSQVGCTLTCKFCHTGTQRLVRNLSSEEILQQIMITRDHFNDWSRSEEKKQISNIVLMGMGKPLYNYNNVAKALHIAMDKKGIAISRKKIILSTSGVIPEIERCARELRVNLALSLHAVTNEIRSKIIPLNKKYPLEKLIPVCRNYQKLSKSKRITFEYVMLKEINDSTEDAKKLVKLIHGIPSIVNIIHFNHWKGSNFIPSKMKDIKKFADILTKSGHYAPIRNARGQDIMAACGQLKSESQRKIKKTICL